MGDEADYLNDQSDWGAEDAFYEEEQERFYKGISDMQRRYIDNQRSAVGTTIRCAACRRRILKKSYQTQFCSNKGAGNCKDKYWNVANEKRLYRSKKWAKKKK